MIRAIHFPDPAAFLRHRTPGSFTLEPLDGAAGRFWLLAFFCPCGCGERREIVVGDVALPDVRPFTIWNGSRTEPTLADGIGVVGGGNRHWCGVVRDGYWEAVP